MTQSMRVRTARARAAKAGQHETKVGPKRIEIVRRMVPDKPYHFVRYALVGDREEGRDR